MGWIDKRHAFENSGGPSLREAWKKIKHAKGGEKISFDLTLSQPLKSSRSEFCITVNAPYRKNQLLYAWKKISEQFEEFQGQFPQNFTLPNMIVHWDFYERPSSFSTEDLISNLVFFYSVVDKLDAETVVNTIGGRFTPNSEDERIISEAIWIFALTPGPGYKKWEPVYFDHVAFLKIDFRKLLSMWKTPSCCNYNAFEIGLRAQQLLPQYIATFGPRDFPGAFEKYTEMPDGVEILRRENKWEWNI